MPAWVSSMPLYLLAFGAGISFVLQQAVNANLRTEIDSAFWAGFVSYLGGTIAMLAVIMALREPILSGQAISRASWFSWTGGVFGAIYIAISILLLPRLGAATVVAVIVVGQMTASLVFDHFGLFGVALHPASMTRLAGAALLVLGVLMIQF